MSLFRACVGGYVGGGHVHPALLDAAREGLARAKEAGSVQDGFVARCGDDIDLVLMHATDGATARCVAHDVFGGAASAGARLRQHGNGGVELDAIAIDFDPRPSEPVLCFFSNKASPGAWNLFTYRVFADPFTTSGLVTDPAMRDGFRFVTVDAGGEEQAFDVPADIYRLLAAMRDGRRIVRVESQASAEVAGAASAGRDPILVVRCESPFPGVEDFLEAFSSHGAAAGGSPLVPVSAHADASSRSMPRGIGVGFQVTPDRLVGPRDLLGDAAFDDLRREAVAAVRHTRGVAVLKAPSE